MKRLLIFLAAFLVVDCSRIYFKLYNDYMYQTSISVGNKTGQKLNVLLDFTSTGLWFFAVNSSNSKSSPFLQLSTLPKLNVSKEQIVLKYTSESGLYDYDFAVRAYQAGNASLTFGGNVTVNSSTFGVVHADNYTMPNQKESVLGVGILGIGSLLTSNVTNYLSGLLNSTSQFALCTRPQLSQAALIINEPYFNKSTLNKSVVTNYSKTPKNSGAFEFNISAVKIGVGFYLERKITAVISTMTNYLTLDKITWRYIRQFFRLAHDKKTDDYFIPCKRLKEMRINFAVQSTNTVNNWLTLPAIDLVEKTKSGYCILKVRPSQNNIWTLGASFLHHHCVQVDLAKQQLTFINNTIFNPTRRNKV